MLTKFKNFTKYVDSLLLLIFYHIYHAKKYFTKQFCIKILKLFVLIKTYEISVSIRKYLQISIYFSDIRFFEYPYFSETKQIEKLDIRDIRSKSQIPSKTRISDPCPGLKQINKYCKSFGQKSIVHLSNLTKRQHSMINRFHKLDLMFVWRLKIFEQELLRFKITMKLTFWWYLSYRNRMIMALLVTFMVAAVLCISAAFFFAVALVQSDDQIIIYILMIYLGFWIVFPVIILVSQLVRLLGWLICFICCCCPRRRRSPRRLLPLAPSPAHWRTNMWLEPTYKMSCGVINVITIRCLTLNLIRMYVWCTFL